MYDDHIRTYASRRYRNKRNIWVKNDPVGIKCRYSMIFFFFLVGGRGTVSDGMNSTRLKNRLNGMMTLTTITTTLTLTSLLVLPCIYSLEQRISTLRGLPVWDVVNI